MSSICVTCNEEITDIDDEIVCDGVCGKKFHYNRCAKISKTKLKIITDDKNIKWYCFECISVMDSIFIKMNSIFSVLNKYDEKFLKQEELFNDMKFSINEIKTKIKNSDNAIKDEIKKVAGQNNVTPKLSFADIVKTRKNDPVVVLKPKNSNQNSDVTKAEIKQKIDPVDLGINSVRSASKGSVVIACKSKEDQEKLRKDAETKLGENYEIQLPDQINPKIKVYGVSQKYPEQKLSEMMKKQNNIVNSDAKIKFIRYEEVKNRNKISIIFETDGATFNQLMTNGKVNIGWDRCPVFEEVQVDRCFNCAGYFHKSSKCTNKIACPLCAGEHAVKDCKSETRCCVNCKKANEFLTLSLDTKHAVWSKDCEVRSRKIEIAQRRIGYSQQ
jgi:hypothetical protein